MDSEESRADITLAVMIGSAARGVPRDTVSGGTAAANAVKRLCARRKAHLASTLTAAVFEAVKPVGSTFRGEAGT